MCNFLFSSILRCDKYCAIFFFSLLICAVIFILWYFLFSSLLCGDKYCVIISFLLFFTVINIVQLQKISDIPDICHRQHSAVPVEKNLSCGEICPHVEKTFSCGEICPHDKNSPFERLLCGKYYPHENAILAKLHFTGTERDCFWYLYQLLIKISILQPNVFDQISTVFDQNIKSEN